jgi:RND superfamily putative drug exporter
MFAALGGFVVRRPWWIILAWVVAAGVVIGLAPTLTSSTDEASFLPDDYESIRASAVRDQAFPQHENVGAVIVFQRTDGKPLTPADSERVAAVSAELAARNVPPVQGVTPGAVSPNGLVRTATIAMPEIQDPNDEQPQDAVETLRKNLKSDLAGSDLSAGITGQAAQALDHS